MRRQFLFVFMALAASAMFTASRKAHGDEFTMALSAEAKAAYGIENRQPTDVSDTFAAGDRVWVWTLVKGGVPGSNVTHVWTRDGKVALRRVLRVGDRRWATNSRHRCEAGAWTVEVLASDGTVLAEVNFSVL